MKKRLPEKSRVAKVSRVRKSAMMGAAATALIAAAPTFARLPGHAGNDAAGNHQEHPAHAGEGDVMAREGRPRRRKSRTALSAISIDNGDDITVGADETALEPRGKRGGCFPRQHRQSHRRHRHRSLDRRESTWRTRCSMTRDRTSGAATMSSSTTTPAIVLEPYGYHQSVATDRCHAAKPATRS